jgi:hypothetical protein
MLQALGAKSGDVIWGEFEEGNRGITGVSIRSSILLSKPVLHLLILLHRYIFHSILFSNVDC